MGRRSGGLETIRLTIELLKRIPRGHYISAAELHRQLSAIGLTRTRRTIERQLVLLVEYFDIECNDTSKPYGYRWKPNAVGLSLPALSTQESLVLALAHRYLEKLLPQSVMESMSGYFRQAINNLAPSPSTKPETQWLSKVRVVDTSQPLLAPTIDPDVFAAVSAALYDDRCLDIVYRNASGGGGEYNVMPLGLAQQGPRLYLVCRFERFDNERILALNRIQSATISGLNFTPPREFDLKKYDEDGHFGFGEGQRVQLSFHITKGAGQHLLESRLSRDQRTTEHDDYYEIAATVVDSALLDRWLRGFGDDVWEITKR